MMAGMIFFRNRSPTNFNCLRALRTDGCSNNGLSLSLTGFIAFSTFSRYFSSYVFFISYLKRAHFSSFGGGCDLRDSLDVDVRVVRADSLSVDKAPVDPVPLLALAGLLAGRSGSALAVSFAAAGSCLILAKGSSSCDFDIVVGRCIV